MAFPDFDTFFSGLCRRNPGEKDFHQAVHGVFEDIFRFVEEYPDYKDLGLPDRLTEPDRSLSFRVCWEDDQQNPRMNCGYRVQFSNALGPYQGGLRFHPSVNLGMIKFLAFEQVFKNSLLPLSLGGAAGGSDFDPKGKSEGEVRRFCQSFMAGLIRHSGRGKDVSGGDVGVGERELGYLAGQSRQLADDGAEILTGKSPLFGGHQLHREAAGYGCVYFAERVLAESGEGLENKVCALSGSGNVAIYTAEKLLEKGARVVSFSDSLGTLYDKNGFDEGKLTCLKGLKFQRRGRLSEAADVLNSEYYEAASPWGISCDLAFPCATQYELGKNDASLLIRNGCRWVLEGANRPVTREGAEILRLGQITLVPGKAVNAGGVAVSGLEMGQNPGGFPLSREDVDARLQDMMASLHQNCLNYGKEGAELDYCKGANLAAFTRLAKSLKSQGY